MAPTKSDILNEIENLKETLRQKDQQMQSQRDEVNLTSPVVAFFICINARRLIVSSTSLWFQIVWMRCLQKPRMCLFSFCYTIKG
jgi:hypothetical protein